MIRNTLFRSNDTLGHMGWYWVACGLAMKLQALIKAYYAVSKEGMSQDGLKAIRDMVDDVRELLSFACLEHDRLLDEYDPANDCEPLRYSQSIALAIEAYESLYENDGGLE